MKHPPSRFYKKNPKIFITSRKHSFFCGRNPHAINALQAKSDLAKKIF